MIDDNIRFYILMRIVETRVSYSPLLITLGISETNASLPTIGFINFEKNYESEVGLIDL
jgi:hypothetical protein